MIVGFGLGLLIRHPVVGSLDSVLKQRNVGKVSWIIHFGDPRGSRDERGFVMPDLSDLSHSYPFLHLSRKFNRSYSDVLELVGLIDSLYAQDMRDDMSWSAHIGNHPLVLAVKSVCRASWRWDMSKVEERGL